jgi:hypothetical protein
MTRYPLWRLSLFLKNVHQEETKSTEHYFLRPVLRELPINVHDQDLNLVTPEDGNYV